MIRPIARLSARSASQNLLRAGQRHQRRCMSFAPPSRKPRSFKNKFARLGLAGGAVYWFANSDVQLFSKQDAHEHGYIGTEIYDVPEEAKLPTLETIADSRRQKQTAAAATAPTHTDRVTAPSSLSQPQQSLSRDAGPSPATPIASTPSSSPAATDDAPSPAADLEDEAASEGAFNEETGEINWDCPCLGGMAHGPCGEEFRTAFSCFVYSKEEPKGVDCIDRFKGMQDCFRAHPDIYGAELTDDMDDETEAALQDAAASDAAPIANAPYSGASTAADEVSEHNLTANPSASPASMPANQTTEDAPKSSTGTKISDVRSADGRPNEAGKSARAKQAAKQVRDDFGEHKEQERSETSSVIPKAAMDTRSLNEGK